MRVLPYVKRCKEGSRPYITHDAYFPKPTVGLERVIAERVYEMVYIPILDFGFSLRRLRFRYSGKEW